MRTAEVDDDRDDDLTTTGDARAGRIGTKHRGHVDLGLPTLRAAPKTVPNRWPSQGPRAAVLATTAARLRSGDTTAEARLSDGHGGGGNRKHDSDSSRDRLHVANWLGAPS